MVGSFLLVNAARERGFYTIYRPEEPGTKERKIEMALTRKLLKGMGLTDEQVDTIIEAHTDTVDGLKADVNRYKADAGQLVTAALRKSTTPRKRRLRTTRQKSPRRRPKRPVRHDLRQAIEDVSVEIVL